MALITISGFPSSGKSTRAQQLSSYIQSKLDHSETAPQLKRLKVVVINDESLNVDKSAYDDSKSEKPARATLLSTVIRSLGDGTENIVIVDAMNYIKGSRYQMYCAAREVKVRMCTVFVATPPDLCLQWNSSRPPPFYSQPTIENLLTRFEEPSSSSRWDSPLFTIAHFDPPISDDLGGQIWEAVTEGRVKPPNAATLSIPTSSTSYLTLLESTLSSLLQSLLFSQSLSPHPGTHHLSFSLPSGKSIALELETKKVVNAAQLQRIKRDFVRLNMKVGAKEEWSEEKVVRMWKEYLEERI